MSPTMSPTRIHSSDPGHATAARPFDLWVQLKVAQTQPPSRDALGPEAHRLEAMAFWHFREHPACIRYDSRRHLMDDNPTSG
jgi:hypothetical protein